MHIVMKQHIRVQDDRGSNYTLIFYYRLIDVGTRGNPTGTMVVPDRIETEEGLSVTYLAKGEYSIDALGIIVRSVSKDAP